MRLPLPAARAVAASHQPVPDRPGVCPLCTRLGVGDGGQPVPWPCEPYRSATARRRELGDPGHDEGAPARP